MARRLPQDYYSIKIGSTTWEVPERYQELQPVNSGKGRERVLNLTHYIAILGAYGQVCSALDTQYGIRVAIKKLYDPFKHRHSAKKAYRELRILHHLKHDNCIGLLDVFSPSENSKDFSDFYMVMHLMNMDLSKLLKGQQLCSMCQQFLCVNISYQTPAEILFRPY